MWKIKGTRHRCWRHVDFRIVHASTLHFKLFGSKLPNRPEELKIGHRRDNTRKISKFVLVSVTRARPYDHFRNATEIHKIFLVMQSGKRTNLRSKTRTKRCKVVLEWKGASGGTFF